MKTFYIVIALFSLTACNLNPTEKEQIAQEINALQTHAQQSKYLVDIGTLDQKVRNVSTQMLEQHGYTSTEHQQANKIMMQTDIENLARIEAYLKKYGHPTLSEHGKEACGTPWLVIHHAIGGIEPRKRNFKYLYKAYQSGDINDSAYTFYLNRMHKIQFGKRIEWNRTFRVEEELDTLYKALDLIPIIHAIDNNK